MFKKCILIICCISLLIAPVVALDGYSYYQQITYSAGNIQLFEQDIIIHREVGTAYQDVISNHNIWHIYVDNHCKENYGDVRFLDSSGQLLNYYIWEDYTDSYARITVQLNRGDENSDIYIWYGNNLSISTSNGENTFLIFDDFNSLSKWSGDLGYFYTSNSCLIGPSAQKYIYMPVDGGLTGKTIQYRIMTNSDTNDLLFGVMFDTTFGEYTFARRNTPTHQNRWGDGGTYYSAVPPIWTDDTYNIDQINIFSSYAIYSCDGTTISGVHLSAVNRLSSNNVGILSYDTNTDDKISVFVIRALTASYPLIISVHNEIEIYTTPTPTPTPTPGLPHATLQARPIASATIAPMDDAGYYLLNTALGLNEQYNESAGTGQLNPRGVFNASTYPFTGGEYRDYASLLIFAVPFLLAWMRQNSAIIPMSFGCILGTWMLWKLPAEWQLPATGMIILSMMGILYGIYKEKY